MAAIALWKASSSRRRRYFNSRALSSTEFGNMSSQTSRRQHSLSMRAVEGAFADLSHDVSFLRLHPALGFGFLTMVVLFSSFYQRTYKSKAQLDVNGKAAHKTGGRAVRAANGTRDDAKTTQSGPRTRSAAKKHDE